MGVRKGFLYSIRVFKATLAHCTALKSAGESVKTASLKGVRSGVNGQSAGSIIEDATRSRTFVGKKG